MVTLVQFRYKVLSVHRKQPSKHAQVEAVSITTATLEAHDFAPDQRPIAASEKDMDQKPQRDKRKNWSLSGNKQGRPMPLRQCF